MHARNGILALALLFCGTLTPTWAGTAAPQITALAVTPDEFFAYSDFVVQVTATDADGLADLRAPMFYLQAPNGNLFGPLPMQDAGFGTKGDGIFGFSYPAKSFPMAGAWKVHAFIYDQAWHVGVAQAAFTVVTARRFDMGSANKPASLASGWTLVTETSAYTPEQGYGWLDIANATANDWTPSSFIQTAPTIVTAQHLDRDLIIDNVRFAKGAQYSTEATFRVDAPAGQYRCTVWLGCLGPAMAPDVSGGGATPLENLGIEVNGITIITGLSANTMTTKGGVAKTKDPKSGAILYPSQGGYHRISFLCDSTPEQRVQLRFTAAGNKWSYPSIQAVMLEPADPMPFVWNTVSLTLEQNPGYLFLHADHQPAADFLAAFNSHAQDSAGLTEKIKNLNEPLARGAAALWTLGWLDGAEADVNAELLDLAITALQQVDPENSAGGELLAQAQDFQAAAGHMAARGYTHLAAAEFNLYLKLKNSGMDGLLGNCLAADQLFRQIHGDLVGGLPQLEPSPLTAKADMLRARLYYSLATKSSASDDPALPNVADFWKALIAKLAPAANAGLFPLSREYDVLRHMGEDYFLADKDNPITTLWNGTLPDGWEDSATATTAAGSWWGSFTGKNDTLPADCPAWARYQHEYFKQFTNAAAWWEDRRLKGPLEALEYGGGAGDDVEGAGLLSLPTRALYSPASALNFNHDILLQVLQGPDVDQNEGYFLPNGSGGAGDVEHAAEFTTNPLIVLFRTAEGETLDYCKDITTKLSRNLLNGENGLEIDNGPWVMPVTLDGVECRHFVSYLFNANYTVKANMPGMISDFYDAPLNVRAIQPTLHLLSTYGGELDPQLRGALVDIVEKLARAWRFHCLAVQPGAAGKPKGLPPAVVTRSNGVIYYGWRKSSIDPIQWWMGDPATGDWLSDSGYLQYTYHLLAKAYAISADPATRYQYLQPVVEAMKLVQQYQNESAAGTPEANSAKWAGIKLRGLICSSYMAVRYAVKDQQANLGLTNATLAAFDTLVEKFGSSYSEFTISQNPGRMATSMSQAQKWLRNFWVLATSSVAYMDRIYVFTKDSAAILLNSMTGSLDGFDFSAPITWVDPEGQSADVAILVKTATTGKIEVLLYNCGNAPKTLHCRLWQPLTTGAYHITLGPADENNNQASVTAADQFLFTQSGQLVELPDTLPPHALTVLVIEP